MPRSLRFSIRCAARSSIRWLRDFTNHPVRFANLPSFRLCTTKKGQEHKRHKEATKSSKKEGCCPTSCAFCVCFVPFVFRSRSRCAKPLLSKEGRPDNRSKSGDQSLQLLELPWSPGARQRAF